MTTPKFTAKQQYWSDLLQQAENFEGSLTKFAQSKNIPAQSLYRWRNYFKQVLPSSGSTEAVFTRLVPPAIIEASLKLALGGAQLQFTRLPNPQWLAELISASHSI